MEFKLRANITISKQLAIEADNVADALKKATAMVKEKLAEVGLQNAGIIFDQIDPFPMISDEKWKQLSEKSHACK